MFRSRYPLFNFVMNFLISCGLFWLFSQIGWVDYHQQRPASLGHCLGGHLGEPGRQSGPDLWSDPASASHRHPGLLHSWSRRGSYFRRLYLCSLLHHWKSDWLVCHDDNMVAGSRHRHRLLPAAFQHPFELIYLLDGPRLRRGLFLSQTVMLKPKLDISRTIRYNTHQFYLDFPTTQRRPHENSTPAAHSARPHNPLSRPHRLRHTKSPVPEFVGNLRPRFIHDGKPANGLQCRRRAHC